MSLNDGKPAGLSDPAAPPPPPASISRAAAEGPAGSLVAQAEAVGIRPIPGAASGWREAVAELRTELGIRLMAFPDGARVSALELRLDQSTEAWTLGVASLTERVRALGDGQRVQGDRWAELEAQLDEVRDQVTRIANRVSTLGAPAKPPDAGELAAVKERIRIVAYLALEGGTPMELVQAIAAGKHLEVES